MIDDVDTASHVATAAGGVGIAGFFARLLMGGWAKELQALRLENVAMRGQIDHLTKRLEGMSKANRPELRHLQDQMAHLLGSLGRPLLPPPKAELDEEPPTETGPRP